jgi:tetratricopeptide (TPR) repeat protein
MDNRGQSLTMARQPRRELLGPARVAALLLAAAGLLAAAAPEPPSSEPASPPTTPPAEPASPPADEAPSPPQADPARDERVVGVDELDDTGPREATIYLKDGQRFTGLLVEETDGYLVVRIEGIPTRFPVKDVDRVRYLRPVLERYEEMRAAMGDDPDQIVRLAEWLRARERYELALEELSRALAIDPNHAEARQLRTVIAKLLELRQRSRPRPEERRPQVLPVDEPAGEAETSVQRTFPLLTPEQINLMKVYEVDLKRPPRLVIKRATVEKLVEGNIGHPLIPVTKEGRDAIYRKPPREILDLMFRLQARHLYGEVEVVDQPESMRLFRDNVHRAWLVNSCATNACHGGTEAGRLILYNRRSGSDPAVYTNFLILERFRLADGTPLIDYQHPERSVLLQYALPREDVVYRHPVVPRGVSGQDAWRPVFRSTGERRYQQAVEWIRSMYQPRPDYPIPYTPPAPSLPPEDEEPVRR